MSEHLKGLNLIELLDLLEPAPEPDQISMMPQTVGWIWLGLGVAAILFITIRKFARYRRASAYRRAGLAALTAAGEDPAQIAQVIRRTALAGFPRNQVAHLTGDAWLAFLDQTMPGNGFTDGPGQVLAGAPYRATKPSPGLADLANRWIADHRVPEIANAAQKS